MVTEEMRETAWRTFKLSQDGRYSEYEPLIKALEAVAPMVRNATLEETAKRVELFSSDGRYADKHDTMLCEHLADAIRALAPSGDGEGK